MLFPCAALIIFSPYTKPNICRENSLSSSRILPSNDLEKKITTLFLSFLLKIWINLDAAGICYKTSLHRFRPLGTSLIVPCFLPFANLPKNSILCSIRNEENVNVHKLKERVLGYSEIRRNMTPLPNFFILIVKEQLQTPVKNAQVFGVVI